VNLNLILEKLPLARSVFLIYAIVGAIMLLDNAIEYGAYADNLLAIGIACGALGIPRAISKVQNGVVSQNALGFLETLPIPTLVFIVFLGISTVALATNGIEFGAFSDNVMKIGIACGVVQAAQATEQRQVAQKAVPPPPPPQ